jgi:hypothetical protein
LATAATSSSTPDGGRVVVDLDAGGGEVHLNSGHTVKVPDLLLDLRHA